MIEGFKEYKMGNENMTFLYSVLIGAGYALAVAIFLSVNVQGWEILFEDGWKKSEVFLLIGYIVLLLLTSILIFIVQKIRKRYITLERENLLLMKKNEEYKECIDNHNLYGTIDGMTGIYNRSFGLSFLDQQIKIAIRDGTDLTISYLDINDLKVVNDIYGHSAGDALIMSACNILRENLRESDILCRMGGDEFLMILPGCSLEQADLVIKRVVDSIEDANRESSLPYKLSISIGMADYSTDVDMAVEQLINQADANMYHNKRHEKQKKAAMADEYR